MNTFSAIGITILAVAIISIISDYLVDAWFDFKERAKYRRQTNPRNIEKSTQDLLELELQQFLLEEEIKEKAKRRMQHPSSYSKTVGGGLDGETREILAKLTDPREAQRRVQQQDDKIQNLFKRPSRGDRNDQYWWGE